MGNNSKKILIILIILLFFFLLYAFVVSVYAYPITTFEEAKVKYYKNKNPINLENVIEENTKIEKAEKIIVEDMDLEYKTLYRENSKMPNGYFRVVQIGENGKQSAILKQSYENNNLLKEELVSTNVTKNSTEKIIEIGTGKGFIDDKVEEGNIVFVSANNLKLKANQDINSYNLRNLPENLELEILEIYDNWYYVSTGNEEGFVIKEGVSKYNPSKDYTIAQSDNSVYSREELLDTLDFNMDVGKQSNLSLEQFEKMFENISYDTNDVFKNNAKYFYYAEEQYDINGVFLAAIGVHESAWGTSSIARNKNNLFGFCAYDADPYNSATNFETYAEGIDLVARVLKKNYLSPAGTVLPDGSTASGRYHSGNTISSVNVHYATDKNWANCVYTWMQKLYQEIP